LVGLVVLGIGLLGMLWGWIMLYFRWQLETHHLRALIAMLAATSPVIWGIVALAYVRLVRSMPPFDYTIEAWGLILSIVAVAAAFYSLRCTQRWIPRLTVTISIVMAILWFLMASTY
jgi:hypothetical protein